MNRREKKKLRRKYLKLIDTRISEVEKESEKFNENTYNLLKELKFIIESTDFREFYDNYNKRIWPDLLRHHLLRWDGKKTFFENSMEKFKPMLREKSIIDLLDDEG